eukprot:jgi/Chrzof1/9894/Cz04g19280.t1
MEDSLELPSSYSLGATEFEGVTSSINLRNMEALLLNAQQQQLRQLRRLHQMKRQAELAASLQTAYSEKQRAEEERLAAREAERAKILADRHARAIEIEKKLQAAQEAAMKQDDAERLEIQKEWQESQKRAEAVARQRAALMDYHRVKGAKVAVRRQRILGQKDRALEARKAALLAKEAAAEKMIKQRQELKLIQEEIKREEESLSDLHRQEIRERAEQEAAAKMAYYQMKQAERDRLLEQRQKEAEIQRAIKAEESKEHFTVLKTRAEQAAEEEDKRREELYKKVQSKMVRADAISEQRTAILQEMARIKKSMAEQEEKMKQAIEQMERTGKWDFPDDILADLNTLESTVTTSPPRSPNDSFGRGGPKPRPASAPKTQTAPVTAGLLMTKHEAALQRILEEEIIREMDRESMLLKVANQEERKRLLKLFAAEREAAKQRILSTGSQLLPASRGSSATGTRSAAPML